VVVAQAALLGGGGHGREFVESTKAAEPLSDPTSGTLPGKMEVQTGERTLVCQPDEACSKVDTEGGEPWVHPLRTGRPMPSRSKETVLLATHQGPARARRGLPLSVALLVALSNVLLVAGRARADGRDVFTGSFLGFDVGASTIGPSGQRGSDVGPRALTLDLRFDVSLWQNLALGMGLDIFEFDDKAPFSELVMDCQTVNGIVVSCDDSAHPKKSSVQAIALQYEAGYQPQFRLADDTVRLSPALLFGYMHTFKAIERSVACTDCSRSEKLPLSISAPYLTGAVELAFPWAVGFALSVRSRWYLMGDLVHTTTAGVGFYAR